MKSSGLPRRRIPRGTKGEETRRLFDVGKQAGLRDPIGEMASKRHLFRAIATDNSKANLCIPFRCFEAAAVEYPWKYSTSKRPVEPRVGISPWDEDALFRLPILLPDNGNSMGRVLRRGSKPRRDKAGAQGLKADHADTTDTHAAV